MRKFNVGDRVRVLRSLIDGSLTNNSQYLDGIFEIDMCGGEYYHLADTSVWALENVLERADAEGAEDVIYMIVLVKSGADGTSICSQVDISKEDYERLSKDYS